MKHAQRLISSVMLGLLIVLFYPNASVGYPTADSLQFPFDDYLSKKGSNIFSTYNAIGNLKWHLGDDVEARAGDDIYAIGAGIVRHAEYHTPRWVDGKYYRNYGGMYIIEHNVNGEKVCALYVHMNFATFTKSVGQEVAKGEHLGQVGNQQQNGDYPEHFHFGIHRGQYPANPNEYKYGDWIFSGYTANTSILKDWYDPTDFVTNYQATSSIAKYSNGTLSRPILTRYYESTAAGHPLGSPVSNRNGGVYVHDWNGVTLQDFRGDSTGYYHGYTAIMLNPNGTQAHVLKEGFWSQYMSNNGAITYGAARSDEVANWKDAIGAYGPKDKIYVSAQEFEQVVMFWDGQQVLVKPRKPDFTIAGGVDITPTPQATPTPPGVIGGNHPDTQQLGFPMNYAYTGSGYPVELQFRDGVPSAIVLQGLIEHPGTGNPLVQIALSSVAQKWFGIYEITQEQYAAFNSAYGWFYNIGENTPVRHVTLAECRAFCDWLNQYFIRCFFPGFSVG